MTLNPANGKRNLTIVGNDCCGTHCSHSGKTSCKSFDDQDQSLIIPKVNRGIYGFNALLQNFYIPLRIFWKINWELEPPPNIGRGSRGLNPFKINLSCGVFDVKLIRLIHFEKDIFFGNTLCWNIQEIDQQNQCGLGTQVRWRGGEGGVF